MVDEEQTLQAADDGHDGTTHAVTQTLEERVGALSTEYLALAGKLNVGWYDKSDPDSFPACEKGNTTCQAMAFSRLQEIKTFGEKQAGRISRFLLRLVKWLYRRLERRVVKDALRQARKTGKRVQRPAELKLMISYDDAGIPSLIVGRESASGAHRLYPDRLEHILSGHEDGHGHAYV